MCRSAWVGIPMIKADGNEMSIDKHPKVPGPRASAHVSGRGPLGGDSAADKACERLPSPAFWPLHRR